MCRITASGLGVSEPASQIANDALMGVFRVGKGDREGAQRVDVEEGQIREECDHRYL